jgi:hypothetical protein
MGSSFMDEELKKGQSKPKTPEESRAGRIANLKDPQAREAIEKVLEERKAALIELREKQNQKYEQEVAELLERRKTTREWPGPQAPGMKDEPPWLDKEQAAKWRENEARGDIIRRNETQWKATAMPYDQKAGRMLEAAERRQEREQGQILHRDGPDRSAR